MLVEDLLDAWNVEVLLEMTLVYRLFIESLISSTRRAFSGRRVQLRKVSRTGLVRCCRFRRNSGGTLRITGPNLRCLRGQFVAVDNMDEGEIFKVTWLQMAGQFSICSPTPSACIRASQTNRSMPACVI